MSKLLLCSDLHIRSDVPTCRIDDFIQMQEDTLRQISNIAYNNNAIIIIAGDILHRAKPINPQYIERLLYDTFKDIPVYFIAGQHDLINHSMNNFDNGSIGVLSRFDNWHHCNYDDLHENVYFNFFNWNEKAKDTSHQNHKYSICVLHKFISDKPLPPWMKDKGMEAEELCKNYNYDMFVCGDNHKSFVYEHPKTKQIVFNCGIIARQKLDEKDYKPNVFLFDTESKEYETIYLLDNNPDVVTKVVRSNEQLEREQRIGSFVELVNEKEGVSFDFESDLKLKCLKEKVNKEVEKEVNILLEECIV